MLADKVAVVTGSTSGIGLGIAEALAGQSCRVVLNGLGSADDIEKTRASLEARTGAPITYDGADLSNADDARGLISRTIDQFGKVDILVNNAGIQHTDPVEDFPAEMWNKILSINLSSAFHTIAAAMPGMRRQGWGRIINVASAHGLVASPNKAAYVSAKHGILGLTKVTALEAAGSGVTVNAICPGWVRTPLVEQQIARLAQNKGMDMEDAARELLGIKQPSGSFVMPEQIGGMAVFLCSSAADQVTGAPLSIDGGWTAQ